MKILIIEDDKAIVEACKEVLKEEFVVDGAFCLDEARALLSSQHYHLILLDVELPDGSGLGFIQEIRQFLQTPIIFISVHDEDDFISRGLDDGADDYLVKPFSLRVLKSRVHSVIRRYYKKMGNQICFGKLMVDFEKREIYKDGIFIALTPTETDVLFALMQANGKILTRSYLLESIWDRKGDFVEDNTLSVTIKRIKNKIGSSFIQTKRNVGYYFDGGWKDE